MSVKFKEVLRELSDKIAEVYDLELAEEMTDIYIDLVTRADDASKKYWKLVKALAAIGKERDELRNKLNEEQITSESMRKSFSIATGTAKKMIDKAGEDVGYLSKELNEERCARVQAENDAEWLRGELEEERRLRVDAEYDKEYYAMQLNTE